MPAGQDRRPHTLGDIARAVEGQVTGSPDLAVTVASSLPEAREGDLSYIEHERYLPAAARSRASRIVRLGSGSNLRSAWDLLPA